MTKRKKNASAQRPTKDERKLIAELDAEGVPYELRPGTKHTMLCIGGKPIFPVGGSPSDSRRGLAQKRADMRRAVKALKSKDPAE